MEKQWRLRPNNESVNLLQTGLSISRITARLLANRGIREIDEAKKFLYGGYKDLYAPWLMKDMETVVDRICQAIRNQERITVYGDYDVDGQTSTALLVKVLRRLVQEPLTVDYYIPHRMEEGYGLHQEALHELAARSCSLILTVDCGVSAVAEAAYAKELGLDLIITDHHEPGPILPEAVGILNPKQPRCLYPFKELCGVGVAYKLAQALGERYQQDFQEYLDIVALGTVADLVPLVDENRILVKMGLTQLAKSSSVGLQALLTVSKVRKPYKAMDFGYKIGPRLNAVGRMGEPKRGVSLLLTDDAAEARRLAQLLDQENQLRQLTEADICQQAKNLVEENGWDQDPVIVVASENWHPGVIGIVASRLVEAYYRPVVVIALEKGIGKASARSIAGFNLFASLSKCSALLIKYGGHEMAAGLTIAAEKVDALREMLGEIVVSSLTAEDFIPKIHLDTELPFPAIDEQFMEELNHLEPFGMGNPGPVLQVAGSVISTRSIGKEGTHLICQLQDENGIIMEAIGFGMYQRMMEVAGYLEAMKFAVTPQINSGNGYALQLVLKDLQTESLITNYIEDWIKRRYPWDLPTNYQEVCGVAHIPPQGEQKSRQIRDLRNTWDKLKPLKGIAQSTNALIYVPTAADVLAVTRQLRIRMVGDTSYIGFEHQLLTIDERKELLDLLQKKQIRWLVSTGLIPWETQWDHVVCYGLPPSFAQLNFLLNQSRAHGEFWLLYGEEDRKALQSRFQRTFPTRECLAQVYRSIVRSGKSSLLEADLHKLATDLGKTTDVSLAIQIFVELGLIQKSDDGITILPKPDSKLDLNSSLLYTKSMKKRAQHLKFLQQCLERGFLHEFTG